MSEPLLAQDFRVGVSTAGLGFDILRVTADPRVAPGLTADLGTWVEYVTALGSVMLCKYTTWDTGWRVPGSTPLYPLTVANFLGATKITPSALYSNDIMTGSIFDSTGNANTLASSGTPTLQQSIEGRAGIWYDGAGDAHDAAVNDPAANSFIWGGEIALISNTGALDGLIQRFDPTAFGFGFYWNAGSITYLLKDGAGNTVNGTLAVNLAATPAVPYLISGQIDKTANRFRARVSRGGAVVVTADVSAAALGTFTHAGQKFGFGCVPSGGAVTNQGGWVPYAFYATGVQTEGANALRDLAVGLGWEI